MARALLGLVFALAISQIALASVKFPLLGSTVAASTTLAPCCNWAGFQANLAIDGVPSSFTHTTADSAPTWQILFPAPYAISRVVVEGRKDCCSERFRDISIEVISGATAASMSSFVKGSGGKVEWTSAVYNPNNVLGLNGALVANAVFDLPNVTVANFVRVMRRSAAGVFEGDVLSIAEFSVFGFQPPLAPVPTVGSTTVQTSEWGGWQGVFPAANAIDNNLVSFTHTSGDNVNDRNPAWQMLLPRVETIQKVVIYNRADCCQARFADLTLELVNGATMTSLTNFALGTGGSVVYNSGVLNPLNALNSPSFLEIYLPNPVQANLVRVRRQSTINEPAILSIGELQLFGLTKEVEFCGTQYGNCALYCIGVGERSGCSGCAATNGTCTWCEDPNNEALGTCVLAGKGTTCGTSRLPTSRVAGWRPSNDRCSADFAKEHKLDGKSLGAAHRESSFSFGFDSHFCEFPHEPYFVDKWSGSSALTAYTQRDVTPCARANSRFGAFPGAVNKTDFLAIVASKCRSNENPLASDFGRECMRLMQAAYCSSSCPEYGVPAARPCFNWDALFRACATWTNQDERLSFDTDPVNNGCPLDPNNIPKASIVEVKCDPNQHLVLGSGLWEETFGLYDPKPVLVAKPPQNT